MGNKRDAILDALENLTVTEFKKFKLKLGSVQLRQGFRTIPRGVLGPLDAMDLTDKLIAFYCEDYGAELTAAVLCDMGMQQEAAQLQGEERTSPNLKDFLPTELRGERLLSLLVSPGPSPSPRAKWVSLSAWKMNA
ncbi:pyrin domain-containing protein 1 isoform X1 [Manis javanica]|uniref:pyrin domain-containing protein 1 isoform X1 n=1 Tax=Manis javanica TaxID=9974 RepID=UPI001879656E|nr:pyrin domain-containing protein 1 isoform X1 [Manis javanica]